MATIVTRLGKGSALTHTELDNNFTNLNTDKLELSGGTMTGALVLNTGAGTNASLSETGIDKSSASAETFNIQNSGAGAMTLQVDGTAVLLNSAIGSTVQAYDAQLADVAAVTPTADYFLGGDGANLVMRTPAQVRTSLGMGALYDNNTVSGSEIDDNSITDSKVYWENITTSSFTIAASGTQVLPAGLYLGLSNYGESVGWTIQAYLNSAWVDLDTAGLVSSYATHGSVYSDGTNMRIQNKDGSNTAHIHYIKLA